MTDQSAGVAPHRSNDWVDRSVAYARDVLRRWQLSTSAVADNLSSSTIWRRLGAAVTDGLVLYVFFKIANAFRFQTETGPQGLSLFNGDRDFWIAVVSPLQPLLAWKPLLLVAFLGDSNFSLYSLRWLFFSPLFAVVVIWLYFSVMESSIWQATPGKKLFGVAVTGVEGQRISFVHASARTFAKSVTWLPYLGMYTLFGLTRFYALADLFKYPCLIGLVLVFASRRQMCLHDAIAWTLVARAAPQSQQTAAAAPPPEEMKRCPACAEWILKEAKKCRYCQERFES